tara:strand:- start:1016 stop:1612 length:597 start_codon:yes stop_codon:yes gene_type:complete
MNKILFNNVCNILLEDSHWSKLNSVNNNWHRDPVFHNYHKLGNKQKGTNGEYVVSKLMEAMGHTVTSPENTGHDRIVGDIKTEIKFSLAVSQKDMIVKDKFIINHVSMDKDWERLVFCGINPNPNWGNMMTRRNDSLPYQRQRMYFMEKEDFISYMKSPGIKVFKHQQGGEKVANDDFICTNFLGLISLPFVKHISEW